MKSRRLQKNRKYSKKVRGGSANFPNVYNTIGYNVNLGNPDFDPSDPRNSISSRNIMGGSRKRRTNKSIMRKNGRNTKPSMRMRKMKGGSFLSNNLFLGQSYNMNEVTGFGTNSGAFWSEGKIAGTPLSGPNDMFSIPKAPLV
jgi:hypothetical protein